jgi:putative transcriptional regulator
MDSLQGNLLVASPRLPDANFYRSVVFMIEHQEDGALG